jgi:hypothetical protein
MTQTDTQPITHNILLHACTNEQTYKQAWIPQAAAPVANFTFAPESPQRNGTTKDENGEMLNRLTRARSSGLMHTAHPYSHNPTHSLLTSGVGYFQQFRLGVGGACASRFTPQAAYWCANYTQGVASMFHSPVVSSLFHVVLFTDGHDLIYSKVGGPDPTWRRLACPSPMRTTSCLTRPIR